MKKLQSIIALAFIISIASSALAETGYDLWLNYKKIEDPELLDHYKTKFKEVTLTSSSATFKVIASELNLAVTRVTGMSVTFNSSYSNNTTLLISLHKDLPDEIKDTFTTEAVNEIGDEGYLISEISQKKQRLIVITANKEIGTLYGMFHFLRLMQTHRRLNRIFISEYPGLKVRTLNHWDNLDRTVERGYSGASIWNWHKLPEYLDNRYVDYARANASIGINGTVLTNVNANALVLTDQYLEKVKALADLFRPYGIKVYLTARFSAPMEIGGLETADPLNKDVIDWWTKKVNAIYEIIPDFGGFLVKANSEGQPGPQNFGRNHADGANMMAKALKPHSGIVMWRAFVYSEHDPTDRAKQAYSEFVPMDGKFMDNVMIQVKNGAIDFQPREPFHPMFGAMPKTPLMMEFQITQEYLGFSTHLVYLPQLYQEVLQADTHQNGKNSTVAKVIDGSLHGNELTGMAGVSNIGSDLNWTGHPFAQANWYGFGRLAWNPNLEAKEIASEWLKMTFSNDENFVDPMVGLLIQSRETVVNYMTPLGLHHIMDAGHHYGPGPWISKMPRPDWTSVYYHKADSLGIGFNRSKSGSNATSQYSKMVAETFDNPDTCPEEVLLWFHHLPWEYELKNGNTLWDNIGLKYQQGVSEARAMKSTWSKMEQYVNQQQFEEVGMLLDIQQQEAEWWKNACMLYFQQFSQRPFPKGMEKPDKTLEYYQGLKFPFAPGIRPRW